MILTIFTPTYNRMKLLSRAYEHLCNQTIKDFVWLIVDDGSTDQTKAMIEGWTRDSQINIEYRYQPNGGKMRAHNLGVSLAKTELFVCLDSDDYLIETAVEDIYITWNEIKSGSDYKSIGGIIAYKGKDYRYTLNGEVFPAKAKVTLTELHKNGFRGETMLVYRTAALRQYPFPEFAGEKFVPEAVVYDQIDKRYCLFVIPKILMICEYQEDGLTKSIHLLRSKNPQGWLLYYQLRIQDSDKGFLRYKYIAHALCFAWQTQENIWKKIPVSKIELVLALPAAFVLKTLGKL